jgi:Uma2 family endonuclease
VQAPQVERVVYPDSDGRPMADNTEQFRWIVVLRDNLDAFLTDFVAGDLLWYPVEGHPKIRVDPDVLVARGRPKGRRGSYRQWEEGGVAPQVVFEVLSPDNTPAEMALKLAFYDAHGVREYYVIDPEVQRLEIYRRKGHALESVPFVGGYRSDLTGMQFAWTTDGLSCWRPDGQPFRTFAELEAVRAQLAAARDEAVAARDEASSRAERLAERLRALGEDPDR